MSLNIYQVENELNDAGWTLLSDQYVNLKSLLKMKCPEGHEQEQALEEWRKHKICETCLAADPYKIKLQKIPPKDNSRKRTLALDAATQITGWALYDDKELIGYGTFNAKDTDITARINAIKHWIEYILEKWEPDFVIIENIQLQKFGTHEESAQVEVYRKLACLQGVIVDLFYEKKIPYDLVRPSEWRGAIGICGGKRAEQKIAAQNKVKKWYGITVPDDIADAICIGKFATFRGRSFGE